MLWLTFAATANLVLITVDGVRHQELFAGADAVILESGEDAGIENLDALRRRFWRETAVERREALLPFLWTELVPQGVLVRSTIANAHRVSFPGYAEILTGRVLPELADNVDVQIPRETVLEIAQRRLGLDHYGVGAFTSWDHFTRIVEHRPGALFINAGYDPIDPDIATTEMLRWSELQTRVRTPWDSVRHNAVTVGLALAYLEARRPRILYLALDETDEWAHARRYDRTLEAIHGFDASLRELWAALQADELYRGRTSLVIATDHGRGGTSQDWTSHGRDIDGCDDAWIFVVGPDTPSRGVVDERVSNRNIAATMLRLLGLDPGELGPGAGEPIEAAFSER